MHTDREVEQLFVRRRAGRIELLLVLEDPAGGRTRETFPTVHQAPRDAVRTAARHFARRGDVIGAPRLRVRMERGERLTDAPDLAEVFRRVLDAERVRE